MASPPELSLECKPQGYSMGFALNKKSCGSGSDHNQTHNQLEDFHARLEEERVKIDAFKRELPLCMQLLTNALEASRQQLESSTRHGVVEEFMPMTLSSSEASDKSDKTSWMTSAQLWSQSSDVITKQQSCPDPSDDKDESYTPKLAQTQRNGGGFVPFSKERNLLVRAPELGLNNSSLDHNRDMEEMKQSSDHQKGNNNNGGVVIDHQTGTGNNSSSSNTNTNQSHRKARRCWSPDLHRRFVNALQMLGGSQVATPKQIRELMKVDGLTNDEVKSHLQKYRLHTRRPSPSPQGAGGPAPQLVVLGGIWVPQEYAHHHPSAHYCAPPPQMQLHHLYNKATSHANTIDDGKSDSSSAGGDRKGLRALRQDGEESNGSDITLKF